MRHNNKSMNTRLKTVSFLYSLIFYNMYGFQKISCTLNAVEDKLWQNLMKSNYTLAKADPYMKDYLFIILSI